MFNQEPADDCKISEVSSEMETLRIEEKAEPKELNLADKRKLHNETVELRQKQVQDIKPQIDIEKHKYNVFLSHRRMILKYVKE